MNVLRVFKATRIIVHANNLLQGNSFVQSRSADTVEARVFSSVGSFMPIIKNWTARMANGVTIALVSDTGSSASDRITSNPAIKGTGKPNTLVTIKIGSIVLGTVTTDSTGAWSFTPTGLAYGAHQLTATQTGSAGTTGTPPVTA